MSYYGHCRRHPTFICHPIFPRSIRRPICGYDSYGGYGGFSGYGYGYGGHHGNFCFLSGIGLGLLLGCF